MTMTYSNIQISAQDYLTLIQKEVSFFNQVNINGIEFQGYINVFGDWELTLSRYEPSTGVTISTHHVTFSPEEEKLTSKCIDRDNTTEITIEKANIENLSSYMFQFLTVLEVAGFNPVEVADQAGYPLFEALS